MKKFSFLSSTLFFLVLISFVFCGVSHSNGKTICSYKITICQKEVSIDDEKDVGKNMKDIDSIPMISRPSKSQIRELAREIGLFDEPEKNPDLKCKEGDISYWFEQNLSMSRLYLEFTARKSVLDIADREGIYIPNPGKLSAAAGQIMVKSCAFKKYQAKLREKKQNAKGRQPSAKTQQSRVITRINMDGNIIPVRSEDIENARRMRENSPLRSGELNPDSVRSLAKYYRLLEETVTNPQLSFLGGDIAWWVEHGQNMRKLNREFASRRAVLDAADRERIVIADQGKLSWAAEQLIKRNIL